MAIGLTISTPSTVYDTDVDAIVDALYSLDLVQLRELCDVEYALQELGITTAVSTIAARLATIGTWTNYANSTAREAAVTAYKATLTSLRT